MHIQITHRTVGLHNNSHNLVPKSFIAVMTVHTAIFEIIPFQLLTLNGTSANHTNYCWFVCLSRHFGLFLTFCFAKLMVCLLCAKECRDEVLVWWETKTLHMIKHSVNLLMYKYRWLQTVCAGTHLQEYISNHPLIGQRWLVGKF